MRNLTASTLALLVLLAGVASANSDLDAARSLAAKGDPAAALELVEQRLGAEPEHAEGLFLKGVLLVELRQADAARSVFETLIELEPEFPEPYNNLAVIQAAAGDYEAAVGTLRRALETHDSYRTAYQNLTKIYSQLASEAYSQALEASSDASRSDIVELVLLGNLGQLGAAGPVRTDEPRPEAQIAATEPTALAQSSGPAAELPRPEATEEPVRGAEDVAPFVEGWRAAWSEQRVDDYLASYAEGFRPANGMGRTTWESQRRQRIEAPEFIRVTIAYLDEPRIDGDSASIRFLQSYESDTFQDRVSKTLELIWEDGGWKILEERSE